MKYFWIGNKSTKNIHMRISTFFILPKKYKGFNKNIVSQNILILLDCYLFGISSNGLLQLLVLSNLQNIEIYLL